MMTAVSPVFFTKGKMALTKNQKDQILKLREDKLGYKAIASKLCISRDSVRFVCASNGMAGVVGNQTPMYKTRVCIHCGKEYYKKDSDIMSNTYCSSRCKDDYKNGKRQKAFMEKFKPCRKCGKLFRYKPSQVYCSNECKQENRTCGVCGGTFTVRYDSQKEFCSTRCKTIKMRKSHEEYYREFSNVHKGAIVPVTVYQGNNIDITVYCVACGKTTTRPAGKFVHRGTGCRNCGRKLSVGEGIVSDWLESNGYRFVSQYTPLDSLLVFKLRYDFAILDDKGGIVCLIEYNGRQHYEPVDSFGGDEEFRRTLDSDSAKEWYAKDKKIKLLTISYRDKNNIENILLNELDVYRPGMTKKN